MYKIIACNIFKREIENILDREEIKEVIILEQGLHNTPNKMKEVIQEKIDEIESEDYVEEKYKGIILTYGLCGNGTLGLKTKKLKLIIPKAHDCMTLFLGSKEKYQEAIKQNKAIYWYNHAWIDQVPMPNKENLEILREEYIEKYGEDNGEYLYEMELDTYKKYAYGFFIKSPINNDIRYENFLIQACKDFGWQYTILEGDLGLLNRILKGEFLEEEVFVFQAGEEVKFS